MISERVRDIPFSGIRRFFELVEKSEDIVSLGVGEPDFPTPDPLKISGIDAIREDYTSYTSNYGLLELRTLLSDKLEKENGIQVNPEKQVLITSGTSEALDLAFRAILDPGDEVLVPEPSYVSYKPCVWFSHCTPVPIPMREEHDFRITVEDLEKSVTKKSKAIIVASPNNPTGSVLLKKDLEGIADFAVEHDLTVISDELYEYLIYDKIKHVSMGSFNGMQDRVITINGFSKGYAFTGWRLGYACGSAEVVEAMMKIHQYTMLCAPSIAQRAALAFPQCKKHVKRMVSEYDNRRKLLVKGLNELEGVSCIMPKGAFYAFPNIRDTGMSSQEFSEKLLSEGKVAVVPGSTFGKSGEGFVRCSYSVSMDEIREALKRMDSWINKK
ncbi:MAG TPA: pyridoxal phosphate-dependent aminotransferase [Candidatus Altiarchaeales archaeon]|nr:pyridoxal phosphate-dependent aminotransferase [Candidatus Altiarchaeales archaeon]